MKKQVRAFGVGVMVLALMLGVVFCGCEITPELVNQTNDEGHTVLGLDYRDFENAATNSVQDLIASGCLERNDKRKNILMIGKIKSETVTEVVDADLLIKKMRVFLLKSGKVQVSTAMRVGGPEDTATHLVADEKGEDADLPSPDLSLSVKIIEKLHEYSSSKSQYEYYLQLSLTDVKTGLSVWEDERKIVKRGKSHLKTVSW